VLLFIGNEEGRARPKDNGFVFDYFIKDHLGNTRMVLTDEQQTDAYPVASMETANAASEKLYYSNIDETRADKPAGYPSDTYTNPNDKVAKLNGSNSSSKKIGPAILLKVMSGDQMNIRANAYYRLNGASVGTPSNPASELLAALAGSIQGVTGGKFGMQQVQSSGVLGPGVSDLLQRQTDQSTGSTRPKAFLNWVLLDEQFKIVNTSTGFEPVGADGEFKTFVKTGLPISQNGYLYVFTSNESPVDVFFDNLQVTHVRGPLLEETHYYPFGLIINAISSRAAQFGTPCNKLKFSGKEEQRQEFSDGSGLEWLDYGARMYDNQIMRWHTLDPHADRYLPLTPYSAFGNNPINIMDPDGKDIIGATKDDAKKFKEDVYKVLANKKFEALRGLIDIKGKTFKHIDKDALTKALECVELNEDEKAYVDVVTNTINAKEKHTVEYLSKEDDVSADGTSALKAYFNKLQADFGDGMIPGETTKASIVAGLGGEGFNVPTKDGSHSLIISGIPGKNTERAVTSGHEVLGHGIPSSRGESPELNNANAIRMDNLVRRMLGLPQRDGSDHGGYNEGHIKEPQKLPYRQ